MKNAIILHGTNWKKGRQEHLGNWFPWLKTELEKLGYEVWLPELPEAWHPDLERYWHFLKDFNFNRETVLVGHSSGASAIFGLLHKLSTDKKIKLAVSVAGFYKDEGWNCEELFRENYDWEKIKKQADKISLIWSEDDPYITKEQTDYLANKLKIKPIILPNKQHFSLSTNPAFKQFPELLDLIKNTQRNPGLPATI